MLRTMLTCAASAAFVAMSLGTTGGAAAAGGVSFAPLNPTTSQIPNVLQSNWAGYIASGTAGEFVKAVAHWTEVPATCLSNSDLYAPWVGIDGYGDETVEQTGVQTSCGSGKPVDSAWYEMYPNPPVYYSNPVSTGDKFKAVVTASGTKFTLSLTDVTKNWTESTVQTLNSAERLTAEAIIEAPGGFPKIAGVNFTGVVFNGKKLKTYNPVATCSNGGGPTNYCPGKITHMDDFSIKPS